jgi:hypothetical protein
LSSIGPEGLEEIAVGGEEVMVALCCFKFGGTSIQQRCHLSASDVQADAILPPVPRKAMELGAGLKRRILFDSLS